ncbi:protein FAM161B [Brachyistius frenatus]|uniref:protein FAM161B n=1 Tax=Brachyistius frenatus TaxID=100188 RepID=UPI0037E93731
MSKLETLLEDVLQSELMLKLHLKALREPLRQQLQEMERKQTEELEKRIHQNALLSTDTDRKCADKEQQRHQSKYVDKETSNKQSNISSPARTTNRKHRPVRTEQCERFASSKTTQQSKEDEAVAECQKKFCALPVPGHVTRPVYQEAMERREKERKQGREQRRQFLLSTQKPFSFPQREKEKREKLMLNRVSHEQRNKDTRVRKSFHKDVKESPDSELKDQEEVRRKVHRQTTARPENPTRTCSPKRRTAERTRKEKLGFLDEKPSFQPKIIHQVPDFSRLHKALWTEALKKVQIKDVIKCQPFFLRTSALPARQSRTSLENSQVLKISNLSRTKSLGALPLTSSDTLPTYITDAARKRCMAIRKSMEMRDSKNQESTDWMRNYQMRSQAMKKTVALHAKLLDPHSSLKEVYDEKLQHHREADQQRTKEYMRELREMKARVSERPYLFEQVKQKNAKAHAEQTYRSKLRKAGLKEQFVEKNGETVGSEDDVNDHSTENDIVRRCTEEENVDNGEKIEDVEEESVKSKGEEMP